MFHTPEKVNTGQFKNEDALSFRYRDVTLEC